MAVQEAVLEMEGMAAMCCDAIAEGLQGVKEAPQEMRRACRAACRVVTIIIPTAEKYVHPWSSTIATRPSAAALLKRRKWHPQAEALPCHRPSGWLGGLDCAPGAELRQGGARDDGGDD